MLNLCRVVDRATGYVFVPPAGSSAPPGAVEEGDKPLASRPNAYALFSSAAGPIKGPGSDVRDIQERWIDAREEWDAYQNREWRREGEAVRDEAARREGIRQREGTK